MTMQPQGPQTGDGHTTRDIYDKPRVKNRKKRCPRCDGSGEVYVPLAKTNVPCGRCRGFGKI